MKRLVRVQIKTPPGQGWRCKCGQLNAVHRTRCLREGWDSRGETHGRVDNGRRSITSESVVQIHEGLP